MEEGLRIDKWLWAVRIYKTRSQATTACKSGRIRVGDHIVKPSREVKTGEVISISIQPLNKTVKVIGLTGNRVSAKLVENFMEDLTPKEEYQKIRMMKEVNFEYREHGIGRPTKRERRDIEWLKKYLGA